MAPTLLDWQLEKHDGPEPRVLTEDVQAILRRVIRPGEDDGGESVALIAEKSGVSTRTIYRILQGSTPTISLDLADRVCLAAESHLAMCRLVWPGGEITDYVTDRAPTR